MSTKTIYKRIALVAVAALGAGVLSVAPANAAITAGSVVLSSTSVSTAVGTAVNVTFTAASTGTLANGDSIQYEPAVTSKPADSALALAAPASTDAALAKVALKTGGEATVAGWALSTTNTDYRTDTIADASAGANLAAASGVRGTVSVTPDKPGVYVITLTADASAGTDGTATLTVYAGNFIDTDTTTAADKNLACVIGATITGSTCAGVAGGRVGVLLSNLEVSKEYFVTATGGSIAARTLKQAGSDISVANTNASNLNDGITVTTDSSGLTVSDGINVEVTRADAGSVTINVQTFNATTGIRETVATGVVTFGSAAALDIATVTVYGVSNGTCAGTETASTITYASKSVSSGLGICVITKNGAGSAIASSLSIVGNGTGLVSGAAVASLTTADGSDHFAVTGNGLSGSGIFTVTATDVNKKVATGSIEIKFFDSVASIVITQTKWGLRDTDANDNTSIATFSAKDKNGYPVAFGTAGAGDLVVDSDRASTQTIAVAGDNDSAATETLAPSTVSALGVETAGTITVDVSSTFEKVTLKIHNSTNTIPSNTITFHATTNLFSTLVVGAVDAAAGTSQSVTATGVAKITGKTGYIIADAATATFFATAGTLASTSAVNFKNGVATVSYATPLLGGSVEITATPSETATVASAAKKIAITSPANAEIASLTTLVNSLIAKINALNKLVIKIQKKVRA
jgi:hypothetical protein